jgi:hypothetical protein
VAVGLKVCGVGPGTVTSTVRQTPSNAARGSFAINVAAIPRNTTVATDQSTRVFIFIGVEPP